MSDWDADDFEPTDATKKEEISKPTDKWEGEDEDDEKLKDRWDKSDSDSESKPKAIQRKKKKKLADIIAEKEAAKEAEEAERIAKEAAKRRLNTTEGKLAEKLRLQKLEENANLQLAQDMLGMRSGSVDGCMPETKEQFEQFDKVLCEKICRFSSSEHYPEFLEKLIRNLCLDQNAATLKKIKMNTEALHSAKLKDEKAQAQKAKKGKAKGNTVKMDLNKDILGARENDYDMDDFM